jgi:hypothetical protein
LFSKKKTKPIEYHKNYIWKEIGDNYLSPLRGWTLFFLIPRASPTAICCQPFGLRKNK